MHGYQIEIKGEDLRLSRNVSQSMAERIAILILKERESGVKLTEPGGGWEHLLEKLTIERGVEWVTVIGYGLTQLERKERFSIEEVRWGFERLGEALPKNLPRDITWAVKLKWLERVPKKRGVYYLTNEGKQVVESGFSEELVQGSSFRKA